MSLAMVVLPQPDSPIRPRSDPIAGRPANVQNDDKRGDISPAKQGVLAFEQADRRGATTRQFVCD
jgi:hypothetical protein